MTEPRPKTNDEIRAALDARWQARVEKDPPPDLQDLVRAHGGHSSIPGTAWAEHDRKMKGWKERRSSPGAWR